MGQNSAWEGGEKRTEARHGFCSPAIPGGREKETHGDVPPTSPPAPSTKRLQGAQEKGPLMSDSVSHPAPRRGALTTVRRSQSPEEGPERQGGTPPTRRGGPPGERTHSAHPRAHADAHPSAAHRHTHGNPRLNTSTEGLRMDTGGGRAAAPPRLSACSAPGTHAPARKAPRRRGASPQARPAALHPRWRP